MNFIDLGLDEKIIEAIGYMGYEKATPIQEKAIPKILDGCDLIGYAQTGTGKTAAFMLPILHHINEQPTPKINTLIIVPTRELAVQIEQQIQGFSYFISVSSIAIYGGGDGDDWQIQKKALKEGVNIIVATPGKLLSHLNMGNADFSELKHLVLDEADRMLDMGFIDDLLLILKKLPTQRQNLMFSATMAEKTRSFAKRLLNNPIEINVALSKPAEGVRQNVYLCFDQQKLPLLNHVLEGKNESKRVLIFSSTKQKVRTIERYLKRNHFKIKSISSDLEQTEREDVLRGFSSGRIPILVATDVMSRGIDIKDIELVINFDFPREAEDYVHRVGRTARADAKGKAVSLVNPADMYRLKKIQELIQTKIEVLPLPAELGEAPKWEAVKPEKKKHKKWAKRKR